MVSLKINNQHFTERRLFNEVAQSRKKTCRKIAGSLFKAAELIKLSLFSFKKQHCEKINKTRQRTSYDTVTPRCCKQEVFG